MVGERIRNDLDRRFGRGSHLHHRYRSWANRWRAIGCRNQNATIRAFLAVPLRAFNRCGIETQANRRRRLRVSRAKLAAPRTTGMMTTRTTTATRSEPALAYFSG